jgi:acetyl-CoA C-acetyltransferase
MRWRARRGRLAAQQDGRFAASLVSVHDRFGEIVLRRDESIRAGTTLADLAKLKPSFIAAGEVGFDSIVLRRYPHLEAVEHVHTGGSSSGIVDGACAVLLGSKAHGRRTGLRPRARVVATATCASEPLLSLGGPIPATDKVLARAGLTSPTIDLFRGKRGVRRRAVALHAALRHRRGPAST